MADDAHSPIDEAVRRRFEAAGIDGNPLQLEELIAGVVDAQRTGTILELVCIDLEFRWKRFSDTRHSAETAAFGKPTGEVPETCLGQARPAWESDDESHLSRPLLERPLSIESYLERFPSLVESNGLATLIQEEFRQRVLVGEQPALDEYRSRFPEQQVDDTLEADLLNATVVASPEQLAANSGSVSGETLLSANQTREFGGYVLRRELGRGGMGIVYEALETATERVVALKVVRRDRLENMPADMQSEMLARFRTETMTAARLDHDHIVTVYEVGEHAGRRFFSMQFVDGPSLAGRVRQGVLTNRQAAEYMAPIAAAVHEAHTRGVLHRDIKPHNIMVDQRTDRPLIGDFGLAKLMEHDQNLTQDGDIVGTPAYASP
ncbi:MAG: serine/threonine-protein kinase, partial [Planctomycetaceae bacterium]